MPYREESDEDERLVDYSSDEDNQTGSFPKRRCMQCCGCCCVFYLVLVILLAFILRGSALATNQFQAGHQVYDEIGAFITPKNVSAYEWFPGCAYNASGYPTNCGTECCNCELRDNFGTYNRAADFRYIHFLSREAPGVTTVNLTGWWLPADDPIGPVIIVQHGMGGSINDARTATMAYLLRSLGYSVILPNLRGHGSAPDPTGGLKGWGRDFPYDTLGAWDYAVNDPDGIVGPHSPDQVGILGLSMGGFTAALAFLLDTRVPGVWLEAALLDPVNTANIVIGGFLGPLSFLSPLLINPAWWLMELITGISMTMRTPEKMAGDCVNNIPLSPGSRNIALANSEDDTDVPMSSANSYLDLFSEFPQCFEVETLWSMRGVCTEPGGNTHNHNVLQWTHPGPLRQHLCDFWKKTFNSSRPCLNESLMFSRV